MADSAISTCGRSDHKSFKSSLGNDELSLAFDSKRDRLRIEVASSSRFEICCRIISKQEEVRQITGAFASKQLNFIILTMTNSLDCRITSIFNSNRSFRFAF